MHMHKLIAHRCNIKFFWMWDGHPWTDTDANQATSGKLDEVTWFETDPWQRLLLTMHACDSALL